MTLEYTERTTSRRTRAAARAKPLSVLIALIRESGGTLDDESRHKAAFRKLLNQPGYEDFRDVVIDEWAAMRYLAAYGAAHPPSAADIKRRRERAKEDAEESAREKAAIKLKITGRALSLVMPNGKKLAQCTGAECVNFGGWFIKVGERVGPTQRVGDVLTNKELAAI